MFGRKCTLCGEKLDGRGICTECGLNNNKSEKHYKVNESSCDSEPLTHIHGNNESEREAEEPKEKAVQQDGTYEYKISKSAKKQQTNNSPSRKKVFSILTAVIAIAGIGLSVLQDHGSDITTWVDTNLGSEGSYSQDNEIDPYEMVTAALPEDGESVEYTLAAGNYIVGVQIPEGKYRAETNDGLDAVRVHDYDNAIYLFEYEDNDGENYLDDLRLYNGAIVTLNCKSEVKLSSDNAQTADMKVMEANPLTETIQVNPSTTSIAGKDFPPGIYDVYCNKENGYVDISIVDEGGQVRTSYHLYNNSDGTGEDTFKYLVLPEGAIVACDEYGSAELVPSESIASADYMGFYN